MSNSYIWGENPFLRSEGIRDVDPQIVGERIEQLLSEHDGKLTPDLILRDAENTESPLNKFFTQAQKDKAYKWDLHTARVIMNSLRIVYVNESGDQDTKYAMMSVRREDDKRKRDYQHMDTIELDETARTRVLNDVVSELRAIRRKYNYLRALTPLFVAIEEIEEALEREEENDE